MGFKMDVDSEWNFPPGVAGNKSILKKLQKRVKVEGMPKLNWSI
jgi:hypothetical protein